MVRRRLRVLQVLVLAAFAPLLLRLAWLQLEPATHAEHVRRSQHRVRRLAPPRRGQILARDGTVLARNQPVFQLHFTPGDIDPRREPLALLAEVIARREGAPPLADLHKWLEHLKSRFTELETRLLELAEAARRELAAPGASPGTADWLLLLDGLDERTARLLNARWAACPGVLEARPAGTGQVHGVWFHLERALTLERTLDRLQELLARSGRSGGAEECAGMVESIAGAFARIEDRVAREIEPDIAAEVSPERVAAKARLCRRRHYESATFVLLAEAPLEAVTEIEYLPRDFPGVRCIDGVRREYPLGEACGALLGWLRRVEADGEAVKRLAADGKLIDSFPKLGAAEFTERREGSLCASDLVGDCGLERRHDEALRGLYGMSLVSVSRKGELLDVLEEAHAAHGKDLTTTLDARLQVALYRELEQRIEPAAPPGSGTAGCAVVMDLASGGLLASVGFPGVDPGRMMREAGYSRELEDRWQGRIRNYLLDRPSLVALHPGSVFKLVLAAAALEGEPAQNEPLSPEMRVPCTYSFGPIPGLHCSAEHGHTPSGTVDLVEALQFSCNIYFYTLAHDHLAPSTILAWSRRLGYGEPTGIDLPEPAWALRPLPDPGEIRVERQACQMAIGQEPIQATPLQVLRSVAALALGTGVPRPHLVRPSEPGPLPLLALRNPRTLPSIREGLWRVAHAPGGTAWNVKPDLRRFQVALKSGTAELVKQPRALHNGWLVGFAPLERPRIAFAVVIERTAEHGGPAAAPLVRRILDHFAAQDPEAYLLGDGEPPQ